MNLLAVLLVMASIGFADDCLGYGQAVTIPGRLGTQDDGGYRRWIALSPSRPICIMDDPTPVAELHISALGKDDVSDRLGRLLGHAVVVRGTLYPGITGYYGTRVSLGVADVEPIDDAGRAALARPQPNMPIKEVGAYDIEIIVGERLFKQARQTATGRLLKPTEAYAPHKMIGEDLMYPRCRGGYRLGTSNLYPPRADQCALDVCGVEVDRTRTVTIRMECLRARN